MKEKLVTPAKSQASTQLEIAHKASVMLRSIRHFQGEEKMHPEQACLNCIASSSFNPLQVLLMLVPRLVIKIISPDPQQVKYCPTYFVEYMNILAGHYTSQTLSPTFLNIKPLYFEVPRSSPSPSPLIGRHWLFREMQHHLSSHLPTNKGVIVRGGPGTGKTEVILSLVENSCFGRNGTSPSRGKIVSI